MAFGKVGGTTEFHVTDSGGTVRNMSAYIDAISPSPTRSFLSLDVTAFSNSAEAFIAGIQASKQVTVSGPFDNTATTGPDAVFAVLVGTASAFTFYPFGTASGQRRFIGTLLWTNYEAGGGAKERVSYSAMGQLTGTVAVGTV